MISADNLSLEAVKAPENGSAATQMAKPKRIVTVQQNFQIAATARALV